MERITRKPLQGITNIIRFNWHYYLIAITLITVVFCTADLLPSPLRIASLILLSLALAGMVVSLLVSWYIYDHSSVYELQWLDRLQVSPGKSLVNINAGFDETSALLAKKYPGSYLMVFDFYDPAKHTEISIERARKAYPAYPGTKTISTGNIPLNASSADLIFLIFAAHEIRNEEERVEFFRQLQLVIHESGKIIITEHQRDIYNFIAYNIGFFHFYSTRTWKQTFSKAGLYIETEFKLTPFISTFVLTKNGTTA